MFYDNKIGSKKKKKKLQSCGKCFIKTFVYMINYIDAVTLMIRLLLKIISRD